MDRTDRTAGAHAERRLLDPHGRIRWFERDGKPVVAKRCTWQAGRVELAQAAEAQRRVVTLPTVVLPVNIVVPELTTVDTDYCLVVTPDLGEPLSVRAAAAADLLAARHLLALLRALLSVGIEAPGFVPRNLFHRDDRLYAIDWEDTQFADAPTEPSELTAMKWDIAWSDIYRIDPGLRHFIGARREREPVLDTFEQALVDLQAPSRQASQRCLPHPRDRHHPA